MCVCVCVCVCVIRRVSEYMFALHPFTENGEKDNVHCVSHFFKYVLDNITVISLLCGG